MRLTLEEATERCLKELNHRSEPQAINILGQAASGRRQLLHCLKERLGPGKTAYIEVPLEDFDSGALALVQLGKASHNGAWRVCQDDEQSFKDKLKHILDSLNKDLVVLFYAPKLRRDSSRATGARAHWRLQTLLDEVTRRHSVVAISDMIPAAIKIQLKKWEGNAAWAEAEFASTPLECSAKTVLKIGTQGFSRLELRLAVALIGLGVELGVVREKLGGTLSSLLALMWGNASDWLRKSWRFLAQSRSPVLRYAAQDPSVPAFDFFFYDSLGRPTDLDEAVLEHCLGFERDGMFVLHEETIRYAREQETTQQQTQADQSTLEIAHQRWLEHFRKEGAHWEGLGSQIQRDYHKILSGRQCQNLDFTFQDQWALAGRCLSRLHKNYPAAIRCYERAVELDREDAYSHHFLAFNRSKLQPHPLLVEVNGPFNTAIELEPANVYWYPRYISWLCFRGQFVEARRIWNRAVNETRDQRDQEVLFDNLHRETFKSALFADFKLVELIINDIDHQFRQIDRFRRMRLLYRLHALALDFRDVVPVTVVRTCAKMKLLGPHITPPSYRGIPRDSWYSAKVEEIGEDEVFLVCGQCDAQGQDEEFFSKSFTREEFNSSQRDCQFCELQPGRFLEVATYAETTLVKLHEQIQIDLRELLENPATPPC